MTPAAPPAYDYLIVGAGFAGAVLAERLASQLGKRCLVVDRRSHIGGNAHDAEDAAGVLIHRYGPHYFRTNSDRVVAYLSQFTEWRPVDYRVLSFTDGRYWPFPINLNTFEQLVGHPSTPEEMRATLDAWRVPIDSPANSEEVIVSQVGWELYRKFFENYTRKQWQRDPRDLDASVCGRIPVRTDRDDRFVTDKFQALPAQGYTRMFERMLSHPGIDVALRTDFEDVRRKVRYGQLIYTGPLDEYFGRCYGPLPYRSLRFEAETYRADFVLPAMQVNYPGPEPFTRVVEIKHATGQQTPFTTLVKEYPEEYRVGSEPYYPVPAPDARAAYERYAELAKQEKNVRFVGRLATYRYYNMDQVIASALTEFERSRGLPTPERSASMKGAGVSRPRNAPLR